MKRGPFSFGSGLSIADGVLSASGGGGSVIMVDGIINNALFTPNSQEWNFDKVFNTLRSGAIFTAHIQSAEYYCVMENVFVDADTLTIFFTDGQGNAFQWELSD